MANFDAVSSRREGLLLLALAFAGALVSAGCGSANATVSFRCAPEINGGRSSPWTSSGPRSRRSSGSGRLGEKWFYDLLRESLRDRTRTATFQQSDGHCEKELTVLAAKDDKFSSSSRTTASRTPTRTTTSSSSGKRQVEGQDDSRPGPRLEFSIVQP